MSFSVLLTLVLKKISYMLKSMTAYGRATVVSELGELVVEITSLNRKHLEIKCQMPQELQRFETVVRKLLEKDVGRGTVQVKISIRWSQPSLVALKPNWPLIEELIQMRSELEKRFGQEENRADWIEWALGQKETLLQVEDETKEPLVEKLLQTGVEEALAPFLKMKEVEGTVLFKDIRNRIRIILKVIEEIEKRKEIVKENARSKIKKILEECSFESRELEERLVKELAFYVDKTDITEELVRLVSHLEQLEAHLLKKEVVKGKVIEFFLQEIFREINTMSAKAQDALISQQAVVIKSEIERIKEQVQNVE